MMARKSNKKCVKLFQLKIKTTKTIGNNNNNDKNNHNNRNNANKNGNIQGTSHAKTARKSML